MPEYLDHRDHDRRDNSGCMLLGIVLEFVMIFIGNAMLALLGVGTLVVLMNLLELGGIARAPRLSMGDAAFFLPLAGISFAALMINAYSNHEPDDPPDDAAPDQS